MAPGTRSSLAAASTVVCSAARLIGLSPDEPAVEPGGEVALAPGGAICVDAVDPVENPATRRATPSGKLAT